MLSLNVYIGFLNKYWKKKSFLSMSKHSDQINAKHEQGIKIIYKYQNSFLINSIQLLHFLAFFSLAALEIKLLPRNWFWKSFTQLQSHNRVNIGTTQNGLSIFVPNDSIGVEDFVNRSRPEESRLCNSNGKNMWWRGLSINSLPPPF